MTIKMVTSPNQCHRVVFDIQMVSTQAIQKHQSEVNCHPNGNYHLPDPSQQIRFYPVIRPCEIRQT
jgi:hypothetical protein